MTHVKHLGNLDSLIKTETMCIYNFVQAIGDPNKHILDSSKHKI